MGIDVLVGRLENLLKDLGADAAGKEVAALDGAHVMSRWSLGATRRLTKRTMAWAGGLWTVKGWSQRVFLGIGRLSPYGLLALHDIAHGRDAEFSHAAFPDLETECALSRAVCGLGPQSVYLPADVPVRRGSEYLFGSAPALTEELFALAKRLGMSVDQPADDQPSIERLKEGPAKGWVVPGFRVEVTPLETIDGVQSSNTAGDTEEVLTSVADCIGSLLTACELSARHGLVVVVDG